MDINTLSWIGIITVSFIVGFSISKKYSTWIVWLTLLLHPFILGFIIKDGLIPTVTFIVFGLSASIARVKLSNTNVNTSYEILASNLTECYLFFKNLVDNKEVMNYLQKNDYNIRKFDEKAIAWDVSITNMIWRFYMFNNQDEVVFSLHSLNLIGLPNANKFNGIIIGTYKTDNNELNLYMNANKGQEEYKLCIAFEKICKKNNIGCNVYQSEF